MTILEVSNLLFQWFSKNDSLFLSTKNEKDDFLKIILVSENKKKDLECLKLGLESYEKESLIKSSKTEDGVYYFLTKPFSAYEQTVVLDSSVIGNTATIINKFCEENNDKKDYCDPLKITNKDIKNLLYLILHLSPKGDNLD